MHSGNGVKRNGTTTELENTQLEVATTWFSDTHVVFLSVRKEVLYL